MIGRIEKAETVKTINSLNEVDGSEQWIKINFEAIKTDQPTELDPRNKGESLWPKVHSIDKLNKDREFDPVKFQCLYQGNPRNVEGLLYSEFKTYRELPEGLIINNYTDTADTGNDYLCSVVYGVDSQRFVYVIDILYTQDSMERTELELSEMLKKYPVSRAYIESNNGGRGFSRVIQNNAPSSLKVIPFAQTQNKESRIFSNSAQVNNRVMMPDGWHVKFPGFYNHVSDYKKMFKANKYDDCADVLTGIIEKESKPVAFFL